MRQTILSILNFDEMNDYKKFLIYFGSLFFSFTLIIISFNYFNDYFVVFGRKIIQPNLNFVKTSFILNNPDKFDSFIFGSSRIGVLKPSKIKNMNCYNMMYPQGIPKEHLENIKLFLKKKIKIKNLLIGLDELDYNV